MSPPAAKGSGALLVDGERKPTDFDVSGGRLRIENADGSWEDVGASSGLLDPTKLLDPHTGLSALVAAISDAEPADGPSDIEGTPMLHLRAKLPAGAAGMLLPAGVIPADEPLAVTLWLDPANGNVLNQMLLVSTAGSVTVRLLPTAVQ